MSDTGGKSSTVAEVLAKEPPFDEVQQLGHPSDEMCLLAVFWSHHTLKAARHILHCVL